MRILGLDMGSKRIGVAISDELSIIAQGLQTIIRGSEEDTLGEIRKLISEFGVKEIVIGLPLNMDGTKGEGANEVIRFIGVLEKEVSLSVKMWDERLTTMEAEKLLLKSDVSRKKRKRLTDKLAAQLILQGYLNYKKEKI